MTPKQRIRRQMIVRAAEGYLELGLAMQALDALSRLDAASIDGHALYLRGEALRELGHFGEATIFLAEAAERLPENVPLCLALGWCYKRTGRLEQAIESLERAVEIDASEAILHYNLACYYALAGRKDYCLAALAQAIDIDGDYRDRVHDEPDFDPLRNDPDFQALTSVIV